MSEYYDVDDGSEFTYSSEYDSDSDDFYSGYCEKPSKRKVTNFVSLSKLKSEYNPDMDLDSKILLFLNAGDEGDIVFLDRLLHDHVPVDCYGQDGWTALMKACLNGKIHVTQYLLSNGSNPNFQADLFTAMMACCTYNSSTGEEEKLECLELLLEYNADVNAHDKHKSTSLMHAASSGYVDIVRRLLSVDGIDVHARDFDGWNAVFHAVCNNRILVTKILIEHGVNFKLIDHLGKTPLILSDQRGFKRLSNVLIKYEENEDIMEDMMNRSDMYSNCLNDLPSEDGEGGFTTDTRNLLSLYGYKIDDVPFADFLNMNEKELFEAGIKLSEHRRFILKNVIHRFHLCPWRNTSIVAITRGVPLTLEDGICMLGTIAKHLTLIKASLRYVNTRIQNRKDTADEVCVKESISALAACYTSNDKLLETLETITELTKYVKPFEVGDLIVKAPKDSKLRRVFKYGLVILGAATTAGYFIFRFR